MTDSPPPSRHARIDAAEVSRVDLSSDGSRIALRLLDGEGRPASVSLPVAALNSLLSAVPHDSLTARAAQEPVHRLDGWSLRQNERGLLLTLALPSGATITFAVQPWQIAAIASLAGHAGAPAHARLN